MIIVINNKIAILTPIPSIRSVSILYYISLKVLNYFHYILLYYPITRLNPNLTWADINPKLMHKPLQLPLSNICSPIKRI